MKSSKAFGAFQGRKWVDALDRQKTASGVDQRQRVDLDLSFIRVGPFGKQKSQRGRDNKTRLDDGEESE